MNLKKPAALLLCALLLLTSVPALGAVSNFGDITDAETAQNVEILQMLDVVSGMSATSFAPEGLLTRAQFTKMAVVALQKGDQVAGYQNYTIFPDVKSSHWAVGYINLAVRGETKFIAGFSDGTFGPDQTITFGQAVTILMRLLGYTDADVGMTWPTGYLNAAAANGLTQGVSLGGDSAITRAQAAKLFVNLLDSKTKEGGGTFGEAIAASVEKDVIILNSNADTEDSSLAIETTKGVYKLAGSHVPVLIQGRKGTLLLNSKGQVMTFLPSRVGSAKDITVSSAKSGTIIDQRGNEYTVNGNLLTYYKGEATTYGEVFVNLRSGMQVTLHIGATGKVECIIIPDSAAEEAVVVGANGIAGFSQLTGGRTGYTIYKHGETVAAADLKQYDVATYISGENRILISTLRLSGCYENAYPNAEAPTMVKMMGHEFSVLPSAVSSLSNFKVGQRMTLLLTQNLQVAGAVDVAKATGTAVGIATVKDGTATVELLDGLTVSGTLTGNRDSMDGQLVSVSSSKAGEITLVQVKQSTKKDALNVSTRRLGEAELAADVRILERVSTGPVEEITLDEIRGGTVKAANIYHVSYHNNGKVGLLLLDNVTGDRYSYGIAKVANEVVDYKLVDTGQTDEDGEPIYRSEPVYREALTITNGDKAVGPYGNNDFKTGQWGGIVVNSGNMKRIVSSVKLTAIKGVTNSQWIDNEYVKVQDKTYAVSDQVICYNKTTKQWVTLGVARAFGDAMTLYVDGFDVVRGVEIG